MRLFRGRNFLLLWCGQLVSLLGDSIHHVAVMWWVYNATGSFNATAAIMIAVSLPYVLFGPFSGTLVDRLDRRSILVGSDLARGGLLLLFALLAYRGLLDTWSVVLLTFCLSSIATLFNPAVFAVLPSIVQREDLVAANSVHEFSIELSKVIGPAIGGLLMAAYDLHMLFIINGLSFILSGISECFIRLAPSEAERHEFFEDIRQGFRLFREDGRLFELILFFGVLNLFTVPLLVFIPYFAKDVYVRGAVGLGLMESAISIGLMAIAVTLTLWRREKDFKKVVIVPPLIIGCCYLVVGRLPGFSSTLILLAIIGASIGLLNISMIAYFQRIVPAAFLGRFMGYLNVLVFALQPCSYFLAGLLGGWVGPSVVLTSCGALICLLGLFAWWFPRFKGLAGQTI